MGLCRDDEEDLAGDAEELLGSNAAIDLDADIPAHLEGQSSQPAGSESVNTSSRKRRASTSKVWNDFDEIYEVIASNEVRTGAKCNHRKKDFSGKSTHGTGHLSRHIPICLVLKGRSALPQSQFKFNPDGSVHTWEYKPDVARTQLCRLIARLDLPLYFGESDVFE